MKKIPPHEPGACTCSPAPDLLPRLPHPEIESQRGAVAQNPQLLAVLDAMPNFVLVLNRSRQIVFANRPFLQFIDAADLGAILGKRPGDALSCQHAVQSEQGCGTTDFCTACGAARPVSDLADSARECRISQELNGRAFDFRVHTAPFPDTGQELFLFFLSDIAHEKRRRALERIFFHDVANIANGMVGLSRMLCEKELSREKKERFQSVLHRYTGRLADEVEAQRALSAAENNDLHLKVEQCESLALLEEVAAFYNAHGQGCRVEIDEESAAMEFLTDQRILHRILTNMIKNAIEATPREGMVRLGCRDSGQGPEFWVHNMGALPEAVRLQIFQRSFSTKGQGRGLGTYSIKLLGERYLKGRVRFSSTPEQGTTFSFRCPASLEKTD